MDIGHKLSFINYQVSNSAVVGVVDKLRTLVNNEVSRFLCGLIKNAHIVMSIKEENHNQSEETVLMNNSINNKMESLNMGNNEVTTKKESAINKKAIHTANGFVVGLASGVAGSAMGSNLAPRGITEEVSMVDSVAQAETMGSHELGKESVYAVPAPEDVLLATDEGVRIAQVDDNASFIEAFTDARSQVGPGGAFEWRGHVYNTYYAEEWDSMSAEEHAEYQSKIDYATIAGDNAVISEESSYQEQNAMASNAEMVDDDTNADEVRVLGVEAVVDNEGNLMTVAAIEVEGEQALLVDVDNDGTMDALLVDVNHDNQINPHNEIYDVADCNVETNDLIQVSMQQNEGYYVSNDNLPDYMNDADVSSMI